MHGRMLAASLASTPGNPPAMPVAFPPPGETIKYPQGWEGGRIAPPRSTASEREGVLCASGGSQGFLPLRLQASNRCSLAPATEDTHLAVLRGNVATTGQKFSSVVSGLVSASQGQHLPCCLVFFSIEGRKHWSSQKLPCALL